MVGGEREGGSGERGRGGGRGGRGGGCKVSERNGVLVRETGGGGGGEVSIACSMSYCDRHHALLHTSRLLR